MTPSCHIFVNLEFFPQSILALGIGKITVSTQQFWKIHIINFSPTKGIISMKVQSKMHNNQAITKDEHKNQSRQLDSFRFSHYIFLTYQAIFHSIISSLSHFYSPVNLLFPKSKTINALTKIKVTTTTYPMGKSILSSF